MFLGPLHVPCAKLDSKRVTSPTGRFQTSKGITPFAVRIAIESARIVNAYGTVIQVLGVIFGILVIIGGLVLAHSNGAIYALAGILIGSLDIAIFALQGALFRMISNYVIAQLEN